MWRHTPSCIQRSVTVRALQYHNLWQWRRIVQCGAPKWRRCREPAFLSDDFLYYYCIIEPSGFKMNKCMYVKRKRKKGMVLYSAVFSPLDRSKRFTLSSPGRPVHSDTVLGFSLTHSSHAAIAQRLFTHISTTVYSQVLIYTAESTEAS